MKSCKQPLSKSSAVTIFTGLIAYGITEYFSA